MALTESTEIDLIEVVGDTKQVHIRKANIIKKDDVQIAKRHSRYVLTCGTLDASDNLVDRDISSEPTDVQAICNAVWTADVKAAWKANLIANKPS